jgi:hypothetical protein
MSVKLGKPKVTAIGDIRIANGGMELPECIEAWFDGHTSGGVIAIGPGGHLRLAGASASQGIRGACVESGAYLDAVGSMAHVASCHVNSGGSMAIVNGAQAWDVTTLGETYLGSCGNPTGHIAVSGGVTIMDGGSLDYLSACTHADVRIRSGAFVRGLVVCNGGKCLIEDASATDIEIYSGGTLGLVRGAATDITLHSGGTVTRAGRCKVHYKALSPVNGAEWEDENGSTEET